MHPFLSLLLALVCLAPRLPVSEAASPAAAARALLQQEAQGSTCAWQEAYEYCSPSVETSEGYISETIDSPLKDIMIESLECGFVPSESQCNVTEHCRWNEGLGACGYKASRTDIEHFQRCIGPSSLFAGTRGIFKQCRESATNGDVCDITPVCGWDDEKEACEFDAWKALTGIGSVGVSRPLPRGMDLLLKIRSSQITEQLAAEGVTESSDILAWKPPPMKCPDGVDVALCVLTETADKATITQIYCQSKSEDNSCSSDPLCDASCEAASTVVVLAERAMINGYIMLVPDSTAALILRRHVECLQRPESECPKDKDCIWDAESDVCEAQMGYALRTIAQFAFRGKFPDCQTLKPLFSSGCVELDGDTCSSQRGCIWDEKDDFCIPSSGILLQGYMEAIEADDDLKDRVAKSVEICGEVTESQNCV